MADVTIPSAELQAIRKFCAPKKSLRDSLKHVLIYPDGRIAATNSAAGVIRGAPGMAAPPVGIPMEVIDDIAKGAVAVRIVTSPTHYEARALGKDGIEVRSLVGAVVGLVPPLAAVLVQRGRPGAKAVAVDPALLALIDTVERAIKHERTGVKAPSWSISLSADDLDPLLCVPDGVTTPWIVGIMRVRL